MKMCKFAGSLLSILLALSMAACGGTPASQVETPSSQESVAPSQSDSASVSSEASQAEEQESAQEIKTVQEGKLILGTSADYAPYEFHILEDGQDKIVGFDISLGQKIADDLGLELVIKDMNFDSILMELQQGTIDMAIAGIVPTEDRKEQVDFSQNYYTSKQTLVVLKENLDKYTSLDSFQGLPVGAQMGTVQETLVNTVITGAQPVLLTKIPELIMDLKTGKVEAVCLVGTVADGYVATQDDLAIAMEVPYDGSLSAVAVAKGNTALLEAIDATIDQVLADGTMDQYVADASALANANATE
jgi:ABC-type amino acid transport substrate-binding protein